MQNTKHALVLTGIVLPGHAAESVWPALASYFRMEPDKVSAQLVPRAPVTLKESDDLGKLQGLQDGLRSIGADSEIHLLDERGSLFAVVGGKPRGPVPHAFIEGKVAVGDWSGNVEVAKVGDNNWGPFSRLNGGSPPPPPPPMAQPSMPPPAPRAVEAAAPPSFAVAPVAAARAAAPPPSLPAADPYASPYAAPEAPLERHSMMLDAGPLPAGEAIHAGFWRRAAAYILDYLILLIPIIVLNIIPFLGVILVIVGRWLYYALMESGPAQATLGKQAFGLKVTDDQGNPISFGRASGRFFAGAVSYIILWIGYFMAGFTERKQALHDMIATTCVVFNTVEPGESHDAERPPMPWYGWVLNIGAISLSVLAVFAWIFAFAALYKNGNFN
ncbi:putative RDD family membrane protein YckC [Tahibacter aquaticus]|uniref:Putative RDD family membrane protein YckC n=1 Tax=Tahibacter aquaticus TaxID=520092 RepID=A0A4R6Z6M9_9GAMM|nr:RDD family protein [Tahibacter aquaticus]TDR47428.1 putative RDD family membrane protein YckC [Tahibacter aquaticus]